MTDTSPTTKPALSSHLTIDPKSPHFQRDVLQHEIGIRFNGVQKTSVAEYCLSEG
jgi:hypothetical protein